MADGVAITAGSGTTINTDDNGSSHEQVVKLDLGANSVFTGYVGGESVGNSAFGMFSVPRVAQVRLTDASSGLTTASTNYSGGDQVAVIQNISSAFRTGALTGLITGAVILDEGDVCPTTANYDIYFWYQSVTLAADNAVFAVSDADMRVLTAKIEMPAFRDEGANRTSTLHSIAVPIASADTSLYYSYVTRGDHNFFTAVSDLQLTLFVQQN